MRNTEVLKHKISSQMPHSESVMFDFFITFARFECALKNTERFLNVVNVKPNWNEFSKSISNTFNPDITPDIRAAVNFILNEPPRKQIVNNGRLEWQVSLVNENKSLAYKLCIYIRRVRNNLLHGGKFNGNFNPESRNFQLINYSNLILNN